MASGMSARMAQFAMELSDTVLYFNAQTDHELLPVFIIRCVCSCMVFIGFATVTMFAKFWFRLQDS